MVLMGRGGLPLFKELNVFAPNTAPPPPPQPRQPLGQMENHVWQGEDRGLWRSALLLALWALQAGRRAHSCPVLQAAHAAFQELLLAAQE